MSRELPLLCNGQVALNIQEGKQTQDRRPIKPQPYISNMSPPQYTDTKVGDIFICQDLLPSGDTVKSVFAEYENRGTWHYMGKEGFAEKHAPHKVGDLLYVREAWRCTGGGDLRNIIYRAEGDTAISFCGIDDGRTEILHVSEPHWAEWDRLVYETNRSCNWRPNIHMPKWAARTWVKVKRVWVEQVQDISYEDCIDEGILYGGTEKEIYGKTHKMLSDEVIRKFHTLWETLYPGSWDRNDFVWCSEFERIEYPK